MCKVYTLGDVMQISRYRFHFYTFGYLFERNYEVDLWFNEMVFFLIFFICIKMHVFLVKKFALCVQSQNKLIQQNEKIITLEPKLLNWVNRLN